MTYEATRITFQDPEACARAMYAALRSETIRTLELQATLDMLREDVRALRADAVRYRWLRDCDAVTAELRGLMVRTYGGADLDREIDDVMGRG